MKKSQILIDVEENMSNVSLIEDGRLNEFYIEYKQSNRLTGNIYKGKVVNVLQGLQTAFVNIGLTRNGFLYVGETLDDRPDLKKSGIIPEQLNIKEGDYCMVQVTKEEIGLKGARLSLNISIPGRYVVYLPNIDFVGISNKITDPEMREKLTKILEKNKPKGGGLIARTICLDAKKSDILAEIKRMQVLYENVQSNYDSADKVELVHTEGDLIFRTVRDMLSTDVEAIICNDYQTVQGLKIGLKSLKSDFYNKVQYYESEYDIWDIFGIAAQVDKLLDRKVMLPSGGSLVIDHTEALTVIDVNTGKFVGSFNHEETVFATNIEAAREIARQIRLRNIGGIVVVDFIDMLDDAHKTAVVEALRMEALHDRTKTRVQDMSSLGLVEITRKKVGNGLSTFLLTECPHCKGSGSAPNGDYIARKLKSAIARLFAEHTYSSAFVVISSSEIDYMFASRYFTRLCENEWKSKRIYLIANDLIKPQNFTITGTNDLSLTLPIGARLLY